MSVPINIWWCPACGGYHWDDSGDHGGYDRISPEGPFRSKADVRRNAQDSLFERVSVTDGIAPERYFGDPDGEEHAGQQHPNKGANQ